MRDPQFRYPIDVHTGWVDFSPALRYHATEQARSRLAGFAPQIRAVSIRISDGMPDDVRARRCDVRVSTANAGAVTASATGADLFAIVNTALDGSVDALHRHAAHG
jgi:ribosome-associated translation inhibitor RaiA